MSQQHLESPEGYWRKMLQMTIEKVINENGIKLMSVHPTYSIGVHRIIIVIIKIIAVGENEP